MKNRKLNGGVDMDAAMPFIIALGAMLHQVKGPWAIPNPRPVIWLAAPVGEERNMLQLARDGGKDIICLAFELGREAEGPVNVAVYEKRQGRLTVWPDCSPWGIAKQGPFALVANGRDVGFCHDETAINVVWKIPLDDRPERGAFGREALLAMAGRVPGDVVLRPVR